VFIVSWKDIANAEELEYEVRDPREFAKRMQLWVVRSAKEDNSFYGVFKKGQ
jgi:hypothetical protein